MDSAIAAWNRRAPGTVTVTREEVARAISEVFAEAAGGCLNIQDAESPDDCADGGCPCMSITNQAADAILALLSRGIGG